MSERNGWIERIRDRWMPYGIIWSWVIPGGQPKIPEGGKVSVDMTADELDKFLAAPPDMQVLLNEYDLLKEKYEEVKADAARMYGILTDRELEQAWAKVRPQERGEQPK